MSKDNLHVVSDIRKIQCLECGKIQSEKELVKASCNACYDHFCCRLCLVEAQPRHIPKLDWGYKIRNWIIGGTIGYLIKKKDRGIRCSGIVDVYPDQYIYWTISFKYFKFQIVRLLENNEYEDSICDGEWKYFNTRGGSVDHCPNCDHWNATIYDADIEGFNPPDLRIFCRCCGIHEVYEY